jgi:predicted phosphodiesterase
MPAARCALLLLMLGSCSELASERHERDALLGAVETAGYRFSAPGGLLHVRESGPERLVLRASCAEFSFVLERKTRDLELITVELQNVLPSLVLQGPVERVFLQTAWVVRFPPGVDRVEVTAPEQPAADFTFLAFGDIQTGIRSFDDVVAKLNEPRDADFILFLGDATNDSQPEEFDAVEEAWSRIALPLFATPGNHDVYDNTLYQRRFGRTSYTCTHKGARFTSVDSSSATLAEALWPQLEGWLELGREQPHVLFSHIPATEVLGVRSGQWNARREARLFTAAATGASVDLMLFGHIHSFDAYALGGIPTYISGGGGALPERLDGIDRHFLKVRMRGGVPDVEVVRVDP